MEIACIPAVFGSVRLLAKLSDQAAAYDWWIKLVLAVLMLSLLRTELYRCSVEVLSSSGKA